MSNIETLEMLFQNADAPIEDILSICSRLVAIDSAARDKLNNIDEVPFLIRAFAVAVVIDNMAKGYELDISALSALIGIPRPTVHRWAKRFEKEGLIEFARRGNRKIILVKAIHPNVVEFFDHMARKYKIPDTRPD